jgi:hypothetical protein
MGHREWGAFLNRFLGEGAWTPVIRGAGTAGTYELSFSQGRYYRIANLVMSTFYIQFAAVVTGGGTDELLITGSPFETIDDFVYRPIGSVIMSGVDATAGTVGLSLVHSAITPSSSLTILQTIDNGASVLLPISAVAANDIIGGTIFFEGRSI